MVSIHIVSVPPKESTNEDCSSPNKSVVVFDTPQIPYSSADSPSMTHFNPPPYTFEIMWMISSFRTPMNSWQSNFNSPQQLMQEDKLKVPTSISFTVWNRIHDWFHRMHHQHRRISPPKSYMSRILAGCPALQINSMWTLQRQVRIHSNRMAVVSSLKFHHQLIKIY